MSKKNLTPSAIKDARKRLGLSRVEFGRALGFGGNNNTLNKAIYVLETDAARPLRREKQEILFGLLTDIEFASPQPISP
ncbi:MAG: hypothetical protein V3U57_00830 [Robiginitomaculum sp.]